jgi:hypothetical protein
VCPEGVSSERPEFPEKGRSEFTEPAEAAPDLTGFLKRDGASSREFIVMEVKNRALKLDDIYQTRDLRLCQSLGVAFTVEGAMPGAMPPCPKRL